MGCVLVVGLTHRRYFKTSAARAFRDRVLAKESEQSSGGHPPPTLRAPPREIPWCRNQPVASPKGRGNGPWLPASTGERFGGERGVEQERLGVVYAQIANRRQRLEGHIAGLVAGLVGPQPL